jgi:hypothetical protein
MKIQVKGTGRHKCILLQSLLHEVLSKLGRIHVEVFRLDDEIAIRKYMPPDTTPGLVIDGHMVSTGKVPDLTTLRTWLHSAETTG